VDFAGEFCSKEIEPFRLVQDRQFVCPAELAWGLAVEPGIVVAVIQHQITIFVAKQPPGNPRTQFRVPLAFWAVYVRRRPISPIMDDDADNFTPIWVTIQAFPSSVNRPWVPDKLMNTEKQAPATQREPLLFHGL
jgi:hypothetical protein